MVGLSLLPEIYECKFVFPWKMSSKFQDVGDSCDLVCRIFLQVILCNILFLEN